jgi:polysaccharide biosynthesis protein PslG
VRRLLAASGAALVAVLAVVFASCGSSAKPAADPGFFGVVKGTTFGPEDAAKMATTKVGAVRFSLNWSAIEPHRGSFDWLKTDLLVGVLAAHGIEPVPFVYNTPSWISKDSTRPPLDTARDRAAWTEFLTAVVKRYAPGGEYWANVYRKEFGQDAQPVPITAWQVWNEPNLPHYFAPKPSPGAYAQLLRLSDHAIKSEDPNAEIVLAGMPGYGNPDTAWGFLDKLYRQPGFANDFDAVALHPYARTVGQLQLEIEKLRAAMAQHGDSETPLWLTELGWGSGEPNRFGLNKGLEGQKRLLEGSFRLILDHRSAWHVQRLFWFDWRDPAPGAPQACSFCSSAGLLHNNGDPKPAWEAYKRFASGAEN